MEAGKKQAWDYLWYALYAFGGLGLELLLAGLVEPLWMGHKSFGEYTGAEQITHWLLTCLCWGAAAALLIYFSRKKLRFELAPAGRPGPAGILGAAALAGVCVALNALDWGTLKILGELEEKGWALFFFQYLYYLFEVGLVLLIAAFGQAFAEGLLGRQSPVPFGGLLLCCTWGAVHILSKGSLQAGLGTMAFSLLYGGIYLLLGRNAGYSYTAMALAFIL